MITDAALCGLVAASYQAAPTIHAGDVRLVLTRTPDATVVAIPGTREWVMADWIRDLAAWGMTSRTHPRLGRCHAGCLTGAESVLDALQAAVGSDTYVITAHSLGGGIGALLGALMALWGHPPARLVTFGAMRAGIGRCVPELLADVPGAHYRHGGDIVPDLPDWPYAEWRPRTQVGADGWPDVRDHFIAAYAAAMVV